MIEQKTYHSVFPEGTRDRLTDPKDILLDNFCPDFETHVRDVASTVGGNLINADEFFAHMRTRMVQGYFRYGSVWSAGGTDMLATIRLRLAKYEETGNLEFLTDLGNQHMIEFMMPRHPRAHFGAGCLAQTALDGLGHRVRLALLRYEDTGDVRYMIVGAVVALLEFWRPAHPRAHFSVTEAHDSPGSVGFDGRKTGRLRLDRSRVAVMRSLLGIEKGDV